MLYTSESPRYSPIFTLSRPGVWRKKCTMLIAGMNGSCFDFGGGRFGRAPAAGVELEVAVVPVTAEEADDAAGSGDAEGGVAIDTSSSFGGGVDAGRILSD